MNCTVEIVIHKEPAVNLKIYTINNIFSINQSKNIQTSFSFSNLHMQNRIPKTPIIVYMIIFHFFLELTCCEQKKAKTHKKHKGIVKSNADTTT